MLLRLINRRPWPLQIACLRTKTSLTNTTRNTTLSSADNTDSSGDSSTDRNRVSQKLSPSQALLDVLFVGPEGQQSSSPVDTLEKREDAPEFRCDSIKIDPRFILGL